VNLALMEPLAMLLYQKLLPGTQLVNRLQDLKYRVQTIGDPAELAESALKIKPMVVLIDLSSPDSELLREVRRLRECKETQHLPVIGFGATSSEEAKNRALEAGVTLLVSESAILSHLSQCLTKALELD
jgi:DNA-binding response OmpR family regulator